MGEYDIPCLLSLYAFELLDIQLDSRKAFGKKHQENGRREQKIS
jgi:hypothetical protein